jgi:hypothetical protein
MQGRYRGASGNTRELRTLGWTRNFDWGIAEADSMGILGDLQSFIWERRQGMRRRKEEGADVP